MTLNSDNFVKTILYLIIKLIILT